MTGIASIPPDGLTWREWFAAMRALNPDADGFRVPECFVGGTFMASALRGEYADPDEAIHDAIDEWHTTSGDVPLAEWLGMTRDEYRRWAERPSSLRAILAERMQS